MTPARRELLEEAGYREMMADYCEGRVPRALFGRMVIYKAMCDLLWTLWGLIQHANKNPVDDFWAYALNRFERCKRLMGSADLARRPGRVQADQRVETILEDHHHVDSPEQLAQHDALVHALPPAQLVARVRELFPVPEGGALVVAPESRARVELREIDQRLAETARAPVGRAAREVLRDVEAKRSR